VSFGAPQERESRRMKRTPRRVGAPSEADAELSAMLLRAAKEIGLEVPKTPPADPSRLDDWFLGRAPVTPPRSPPVPFFPEVHEELVKTWRAPYLSRLRPGSSPLATLDGGAARGYVAVPQVERTVAVHLCLRGAVTWRDRPHLPSRAAYHAAGQAATALHAMATLQVYQAQALKHLHEGGSDQGAMQELRAATDFALRARSDTNDVDKARFLDAPISQGGLFGDTFSAVQKQMEAIKHILPRRDSATTSAGPQPPPARHRGRPSAASKTPAPSTGAARVSGTGQEHPQESCEA
ncbi:hypothetical protein M9458_040850, partial [Cirrhinus mrigala]